MKWFRHQVGTIRYIQRFAWFPTKMEGQDYLTTIWLEKYWDRQKFTYLLGSMFAEYGWVSTFKTQNIEEIEEYKNRDIEQEEKFA